MEADAGRAAEEEAVIPYTAPDVSVTDPFEAECSTARKLVLRALDSKIAQQDDAAALAAIQLAAKLASNVIEHPDDAKYTRVKASNPTLQRSLSRVPGGQDLLIAMGFRTVVVEFEEHWAVAVSPLSLRVLQVAAEGLAHYEQLVAARAEQKAKARSEKVSGTNAHREQILAEIEVRAWGVPPQIIRSWPPHSGYWPGGNGASDGRRAPRLSIFGRGLCS
jgi:hypothetical protein